MNKCVLLLLLLSGCSNKTEIPADINHSGTLIVRHEISVAADLLGQFQDVCRQEAIDAGLIEGSDEFNEAVTFCTNRETTELIDQLTRLIGGLPTEIPIDPATGQPTL